MNNQRKKVLVVVFIMIPIASLHFVTGSHYRGPLPWFINGYLLDILVPMGFYLLLCLNMNPLLSSWFTKASLVFGAAFFVEMAQRMGIPIFGRTFDPWDIVMYALGVALAAFLDMILFPWLFSFWKSDVHGDAADRRSAEGLFTWRYK